MNFRLLNFTLVMLCILLFFTILKSAESQYWTEKLNECEIGYPNQPSTRCVCVEQKFTSLESKMANKGDQSKDFTGS